LFVAHNFYSNFLSSKVTLPFNFLRAAHFKPQTVDPPSETMVWEDDTPRKLLSEDGYIMVATTPKLMDDLGTVNIFSSSLLPRS
jgi:hypothetical protein